MLPIKTVLVPTDFSAFAQSALPIACALARDYGANVILLYVRAIPETVVGEFGAIAPGPRESDESLKGKLKTLLPSEFTGRVEFQVRGGDAATEILATAKQNQCDMIVLGTHGRSGLSRLLVGSVAEAVLRLAPCPVLTIKGSAPKATVVAANPAEEEPDMDATDLTTVCTLPNPGEAEVIRNALTSEGIRCFVEGANQAGLTGTLGIPIKLQVRVGDADRAAKFIRRHEQRRR